MAHVMKQHCVRLLNSAASQVASPQPESTDTGKGVDNNLVLPEKVGGEIWKTLRLRKPVQKENA